MDSAANLFYDFLTQCEAAPDRTALIDEGHQLSYLQLKQRAECFNGFLNKQSVPIWRIAIALDRGIEAVAAILGVLFHGACYVPLDIKNPANRLRFITKDADVQFVIGKGTCPDWIEDANQWIDIDYVENNSSPLASRTDINPDALAAILYTSGSTGTPKGVALSQCAMNNFARWAGLTFQIDRTDRIASLAPFHFDLSVFDLFTSLSFGAAVHFVPSRLTLSPSRLTDWLQRHQITTWYTVPSLLSFIALKGSLDTTPLPELKTILFAGEVFPTKHLIKLAELLPESNLYNLYGPTETNVCCYWPVDRDRLQENDPIPIGFPACNAKLQITDNTSELMVKCDNNYSGYWQKGRLIEPKSGTTWHLTGDKVSLNRYGEYCYHGRLDRMLKCSGYRVEPAEIESVINHLPGVENCAVVGVRDAASGQRPAAAIVLNQNTELGDIVKCLKQKLPVYMQPFRILTIDALPYLSNGKVDYLSLEKQLN